jgi:hypothetical protein
MGPDAGLSAVQILHSTAASTEELPRPRGEAALWQMHFNHLEERMDRLDRTVGAAIDLLHALLHPEKAQKPGTPAGR